MKKVLITFGDENYAARRQRLCEEVAALRVFDETTPLGPENLSEPFQAKHMAFIRLHPRGFGYWIWKPHIIATSLQKLQENDVLVYADAGCGVEPRNAARLADYFARAQKHPSGILAFALRDHLNRAFTKMDVFEAMKAKAFADVPMLITTLIVARKCAASVRFIDEWQRWCEDYRLITDQPSAAPNYPEFETHRHDQSVFSLLGRLRGVDVLPDETFGPGAASPILARRLRPKRPFVAKLKRSLLKRRAEAAWKLGLRR